MDTRHDFRLFFATDISDILRLNVARANPNASPQQISAAMQGIIDSGAVISRRGIPVGLSAAELVSTERSEFVLS